MTDYEYKRLMDALDRQEKEFDADPDAFKRFLIRAGIETEESIKKQEERARRREKRRNKK